MARGRYELMLAQAAIGAAAAGVAITGDQLDRMNPYRTAKPLTSVEKDPEDRALESKAAWALLDRVLGRRG